MVIRYGLLDNIRRQTNSWSVRLWTGQLADSEFFLITERL